MLIKEVVKQYKPQTVGKLLRVFVIHGDINTRKFEMRMEKKNAAHL